jgi:hypothetical protein
LLAQRLRDEPRDGGRARVSKCVWSSQKKSPTGPVVLALTSPPAIGQNPLAV